MCQASHYTVSHSELLYKIQGGMYVCVCVCVCVCARACMCVGRGGATSFGMKRKAGMQDNILYVISAPC